MVRNKAARQYLREVKALLPGAGTQKKEIVHRIGTMVAEFLAENPEADYEAIVSRLGSPNQIAASCLEEMDTAEVMKKLHTKKRIVCIVAAAALAVVLLWAGVVAATYETHTRDMNGYFTEQIYEQDNSGGINNEAN